MSTSHRAHSTILAFVRKTNPHEDYRRQRLFAWAVTALLVCGSPLLSRWITVVSGPAKAKSKLRRFYRWLNNDLIDVAAYYQPFIQSALAGWKGEEIVLAIDGTSVRDDCVVCRVSLIYRGRAVPICWKTMESRSHSIAFSSYVELLEQARAILPVGCSVTLLGDRGFGHRKLMKWCRKAGWHYILRLKADSWVILEDGDRRQLHTFRPDRQSLLHLPNARLLESSRKPTDPLHIHIIRAPEPDSEYWCLASDRADGCAVVAHYALRAGIEASFKDDKSGGWNWEASPMTKPRQVDRLCLLMAVATLYAVTEGALLVDLGQREQLDPHETRGLSYFKIGVRSFQQFLFQGRRLRLRLRLDPKPDPEPVSPYGIPFLLFGKFTWIPARPPAGC